MVRAPFGYQKARLASSSARVGKVRPAAAGSQKSINGTALKAWPGVFEVEISQRCQNEGVRIVFSGSFARPALRNRRDARSVAAVWLCTYDIS